MSYLPQLRESLVKAAERQASAPASGVASAARVRRPWSPNGLLIAGASLAALAAAAVVLVLAGHRAGSPASAPAGAYGSRAAAQAAAAQILATFGSPAGSVRLDSDPTRPAQLGNPSDAIPVAGGVDLHRFYFVGGDPQGVLDGLGLNRRFASNGFGGGVSSTGTAESSGAAGSNGVTMQASETVNLAPVGSIARRIEVQTIRLSAGRTALRVDAQAWWMVPRPVAERFPTDVRSIGVTVIHPPQASHWHPPARLTGANAREAAALLNALPVMQPGQMTCSDRSRFQIRLAFPGTDSVAALGPECSRIDVIIGGVRQPPLTWLSPASAVDPFRVIRLMYILSGSPPPKSLAALAQARTVHGGSGPRVVRRGSASSGTTHSP